VQDVKFSSDSRTAREAVGHVDARTNKLYQDHGRESQMDWASRRLLEATSGEPLEPAKKIRRKDKLLPPLATREALQQIKPSQLNARIQPTVEAETDELEFDMPVIDPLLLELGATENGGDDLEASHRFQLLSNAPRFISGSWIDFVSMMATQTSLQAAPPNTHKVTLQSKHIYHTYECPHCDFGSHSRWLREDHVKNVHEGRTFTCPTCAKEYVSETHMKKHCRQIHRHIIPCTNCDQTFTMNSELKLHVARAHTNEKNFQCSQCPKVFALEALVSIHKNAVHVPKALKHVCEGCPRAYASKADRDSHQWNQHSISAGRQLHDCPGCNFQTVLLCRLTQHRRDTRH